MEILENKRKTVVRFGVDAPDHWWEKEEPPKPDEYIVHLQSLGTNGMVNDIYIGVDSLIQVTGLASKRMMETSHAWLYPVTECCERPMPRELLATRYVGDRLTFRCKKGYGCKAKGRKEECC